jgi:hypothetical protein
MGNPQGIFKQHLDNPQKYTETKSKKSKNKMKFIKKK